MSANSRLESVSFTLSAAKAHSLITLSSLPHLLITNMGKSSAVISPPFIPFSIAFLNSSVPAISGHLSRSGHSAHTAAATSLQAASSASSLLPPPSNSAAMPIISRELSASFSKSSSRSLSTAYPNASVLCGNSAAARFSCTLSGIRVTATIPAAARHMFSVSNGSKARVTKPQIRYTPSPATAAGSLPWERKHFAAAHTASAAPVAAMSRIYIPAPRENAAQIPTPGRAGKRDASRHSALITV